VEDLGGHSEYRNCVFWRNELEGGYYTGERYELSLADATRVSGCFFGGRVIDSGGVIAQRDNCLAAPDPKFDLHFNAKAPACQGAGFRIATD
jgi:hypothetical protein